MNFVRLRELQKSIRSFVIPHPRNGLSGAPRCYGAVAVVENASFSKYKASQSHSGSRNKSNDEFVPGQDHLGSDGRNSLENGAKIVQNATKISRSWIGEARSMLRPEALQHPDTQRESLTVADVYRELDTQKDPAMAWTYFVWAGKQPGFKHGFGTCHQMIRTFCKTKNFDAVPELLEFMRKADIPLRKHAWKMIMQGLARSGRHRDAANIFRDLVAWVYKANTFLYNCYLNALVKAGDFDQIEAAYAEMRRSGCVPSAHNYGILINGFGRSKQTLKAWETYTEMKAQGFTPDEVTSTRMMSILKAAGETEKALQVMDKKSEHGGPTRGFLKVFSSNAVATVKDPPSGAVGVPKGDVDPKGSWEERVLSLLRKVENPEPVTHALINMVTQDRIPSTQLCNSVLRSLGRTGKVDLALELVRHLRSKNVLDDVSYEFTIDALCRASKVDEALQLKGEMQEQGLRANMEVYNTVMRHLYKTRQPNRVFEFFSQLPSFKPTTSTYITLMLALCETDEVDKVLRCLKNAGLLKEYVSTRAQAGLCLIHSIRSPRLSVYMLLLSNLCWNHRADDAVDLVCHMQENGVFLRMRTNSKYSESRAYRYVLLELGFQGQVGKAWRLFQGLGGGVADKARIYRDMLMVLIRAGWFPQVHKVIAEMRSMGSPPTVYSYTVMMESLARRGKLDDMQGVLDLMESDGIVPSTYTYNVLSGAFARAGQLDKAYSIFEQGIDKGCIPDVITYNGLLRGYFRAKRLPEAIDLYNAMLAMGCEPNAKTYGILFNELHNAGLPEIAAQVLAIERRRSGPATIRIALGSKDSGSSPVCSLAS